MPPVPAGKRSSALLALVMLTVPAAFNGDGKLDLAVASGNNCGGLPINCVSSFSILPGNADGTFQPTLNGSPTTDTSARA